MWCAVLILEDGENSRNVECHARSDCESYHT